MCQNNKPLAAFNHTAHQNMWRELACTGGSNKELTEEIRNYYHEHGQYPIHNCFACQAVVCNHTVARCDLCPLQWPDGIYCTAGRRPDGKKSLFYVWSTTRSERKRRLIAREIAELPVRPDWPGEII